MQLFISFFDYIKIGVKVPSSLYYVIKEDRLSVELGPLLTSHLCVKRERPLIITVSLYRENIVHYHFYLKHLREEEQRCSS